MAMTVVMQLPPSESSKILVNLESRYGMCARPFVSVKALMTFPSALAFGLSFYSRRPLTSRARQRYALGAG